MNGQQQQNEFDVHFDLPLPNQTVSLLETKANLTAIEKSMYKNKNKYYTSFIKHIYYYENPIHQTDPINKSSKPPEVYATAASNDSSSFCAGFSNGEIHVFNELTRKIIQNSQDTILSIRYHPIKSYILLSITSTGDVVYSHIPSCKKLNSFNIENKIPRSLDFSLMGDKFAIGFADGEVHVYDEQTQTLEKVFKSGTSFTTGHLDQVHSVVFDKGDCNRIITGGRDKRVLLWDVRSCSCTNMTIGPLTIGDSIDIKDNIIIGGNYETPGNVMLFDIRNMKKPMNVIKTMSQLYVCKYSKKDKTDLFAVGGYKIGAMKLYKAKTCEEVGGIEGCFPVYSLDFSGNGNNIVYGNSDGGVRIVTV